jgi:hydroxylamine reductase (hybrid-cluster protein)
MSSMFCYQCVQTAKGTGCTAHGVCGKDPETAALQDLLVHALKGIAWYAHRAGQLGARSHDVDLFTIEALFTMVTNVNFDPARVQAEVPGRPGRRPHRPPGTPHLRAQGHGSLRRPRRWNRI